MKLATFRSSGREKIALVHSQDSRLFDLAAAFAICESAELRRPVTVDEVLNGSVAGYQAEIDRHYGLA